MLFDYSAPRYQKLGLAVLLLLRRWPKEGVGSWSQEHGIGCFTKKQTALMGGVIRTHEIRYTIPMANYSFDIVSQYDKAELNNVFLQTSREIVNRYDFKNTPAAIEWLDDKTGIKVTAAHDMHLEAIIDIFRRGLINRSQSTKVLDLSKPPVNSNLKLVQEIPFIAGLDGERAKTVAKSVRDAFSRAKPVIQGDAVRVTSSSKDELQQIMSHLDQQQFDWPLSYTNYR